MAGPVRSVASSAGRPVRVAWAAGGGHGRVEPGASAGPGTARRGVRRDAEVPARRVAGWLRDVRPDRGALHRRVTPPCSGARGQGSPRDRARAAVYRAAAGDDRSVLRGAGTRRAGLPEEQRIAPPGPGWGGPVVLQAALRRADSPDGHPRSSAVVRRAGLPTVDSRAGRAGDLMRGARACPCRGSGCPVREDCPGSAYTCPHPDGGPGAERVAGRAERDGSQARPVARRGAAVAAAPGTVRGRVPSRAGGRSSPAPIRESGTPAPTERGGPAGLGDRRAVYRAVADERRIHRRSSCLLYRPDPRLPVVTCVVPNTSPGGAHRTTAVRGTPYPTAAPPPGRPPGRGGGPEQHARGPGARA